MTLNILVIFEKLEKQKSNKVIFKVSRTELAELAMRIVGEASDANKHRDTTGGPMEIFELNHTAGVTCPGQGRSGRFEVPYTYPVEGTCYRAQAS